MKKVYQEVSIRATRTFVDENGKKKKQTKKFYQTINPWNKNQDGTIKNRWDIMKEIKQQASEWKNDRT